MPPIGNWRKGSYILARTISKMASSPTMATPAASHFAFLAGPISPWSLTRWVVFLVTAFTSAPPCFVTNSAIWSRLILSKTPDTTTHTPFRAVGGPSGYCLAPAFGGLMERLRCIRKNDAFASWLFLCFFAAASSSSAASASASSPPFPEFAKSAGAVAARFMAFPPSDEVEDDEGGGTEWDRSSMEPLPSCCLLLPFFLLPFCSGGHSSSSSFTTTRDAGKGDRGAGHCAAPLPTTPAKIQ
mmetsp:Transcript_37116/g.73512  ORF Transcript_37116/g.73512 Transcript_37116/m.73512 type:complete len:242 (-) Transcript_37116:1227-1952(-)